MTNSENTEDTIQVVRQLTPLEELIIKDTVELASHNGKVANTELKGTHLFIITTLGKSYC